MRCGLYLIGSQGQDITFRGHAIDSAGPRRQEKPAVPSASTLSGALPARAPAFARRKIMPSSRAQFSHALVRTSCTRDCPGACGLVATVDNGKVTSLVGNRDHPQTQGHVCVKASRYLRRVHSPSRVLRPLRRSAGKGSSWQEISWDAALDELAARLQETVAAHGPESILYYQGFGERTALKILNARFFNHLGGVTTLRGTLCGGTGYAAMGLDVGCRVSHDPLDHYNSRSVVLWGRNPAVTHISLAPILADVRRRGGTVALVDPRTTESASLADLHLRPVPGSDAFLALAAAKLLLAAGCEDRDFLENRCENWPAFRAILDGFDLEHLSARCQVPMVQIQALADLYMRQRPTATLLGWGLHRYVRAELAIRAIQALAAMAGMYGVPGGGVSQGFEEWGPYDPEGWGEHLAQPRRKLLMPCIGRELLAADPPVRLAMITCGNPVNMAPNSAMVAQALDAVPFVAMTGHFLDDTADHADLFLPATTFLEERDIVASFGHNHLGAVNPCMAPLGQTRSEFDIFQDLAGRFPFAQDYVAPADQWFKRLLASQLAQGLDLDELFATGFARQPAPMVPWTDHVFPTPSGRFRMLDALDPDDVLPRRDPAYPLRLLTISPRDWLCSEIIPEEHQTAGPLPVYLHPDTVVAHGLSQLEDGAPVLVQSPVGQLPCRLRRDAGIHPQAAAIPRGGWVKHGRGVNVLTRDIVSHVGEGTPYYETAVRVVLP